LHNYKALEKVLTLSQRRHLLITLFPNIRRIMPHYSQRAQLPRALREANTKKRAVEQ
jgi:hypothetical protein